MHIIFPKKHLLSLYLPCILQSTQLYVQTPDIRFFLNSTHSNLSQLYSASYEISVEKNMTH